MWFTVQWKTVIENVGHSMLFLEKMTSWQSVKCLLKLYCAIVPIDPSKKNLLIFLLFVHVSD